VQLSEIVAASAAVGAVPGRLEKIERIAELLRRTDPEEAEIVVAWLTGGLRQGRIGIGASLIRSISAGPAPSATLTAGAVNLAFERMARVSGAGSSREKARLLGELFGQATSEERSFLIRLLFGELRQGALEGVMAEAIARAAGLPIALIRRAVMAKGSLEAVARAALAGEAEELGRCGVQLFRPVQPMLAQPAEDTGAAIERLGEAALEYKLDGARVQIHREGDVVRVYSRGLREVTQAVPEVVAAVRALPGRSLILDGETIALRGDGRPHPFQITMRRFGRKLEVEELRQDLPLSLFLFDLLYLEGQSMIAEPYEARIAALEALRPADVSAGREGGGVSGAPGNAPEGARTLLVPRLRAAGAAEAESFLQRALAAGHEGIMAKDPKSSYEAGSRGFGWLKIKAAETLDLVVLAAEWGNGRRQGWLSNLHLGARDPERNAFVMLGKTFKGMTDAMLAWQTEKLLGLEIGRDGMTVHVRPELVVEIAFSDVQASPTYPGGLALRFARVKRYRTDKSADQADTIERVRQIHRRTAEAERGA
jgi:DNA ligase-1